MPHINSQEKVKNLILDLERNFPVDKWKIKDIDIWPVIRIKLYLSLLNPVYEKKRIHINTSKKWIPISLNFFKSCFFLLYLFYRLKRKKIIFFGAHFHRILQNGEYLNRFYDPIIGHHNLESQVYILEYQKFYSNSVHRKSVIDLSKHINHFKLVSKLKRNENIDKSQINLEGFDSFINQLENLNIRVKLIGITEKQLIKWTQKIIKLSLFFDCIYERVKPNKIVFLGYYGYDDLYAALISANTRNIRTIDFQHGPQTNVHMAYSSWTKIGPNGFNTMPQKFWNWDQNSKDNIDSWARKVKNVSSLVIGQPALGFYLNSKIIPPKQEANYILYSLQTSPIDLLSPKIIKLIKSTQQHWILRLHPRDNTNLSELEYFLNKNGIQDKTTLQRSAEFPLPDILIHTQFHVTNYSGCTIEAWLMGIPTLLIHNVGKEMFLKYIDNDLVYYLNQEEKKFVDEAKKIIHKSRLLNYSPKTHEIFNPLK